MDSAAADLPINYQLSNSRGSPSRRSRLNTWHRPSLARGEPQWVSRPVQQLAVVLEIPERIHPAPALAHEHFRRHAARRAPLALTLGDVRESRLHDRHAV